MGAETIRGKVWLVGAGPGDPELLTLRALRLIREAGVILHDDLVSREILEHAPPHAIIENVGKRCGAKAISQEQINARMIEFARAGLSVVRLKGGDPSLFGRAAEEIEALARAGVEYEIVPGVTAASAAAAAAGISLTDRRAASQVIFLAGHRAGPEAIEIPAPGRAGKTVAVYMPAGNYESLATAFMSAGWLMETPVAIVAAASSRDQRIVRGTLASLGSLASVRALPSPAILLVGEVTAERVAETECDVKVAPAAIADAAAVESPRI